MNKKLLLSLSISILVILMSYTTIFAAQIHTYNIGRLPQKASYTGFWLQGTLPELYPYWYPGAENKINYEFWQRINNNSGYWVEMGYHAGYAFNSDGSPNPNSSYFGLFTAKYNAFGWSLSTFPNVWAAGENHTMGTSTYQEGPTWYTDMKADGNIYITYSYAGTSNTGAIDAGLEWGVSDGNSSKQSLTLPSSMYNLNVRDNGVWKTWKSIGGVYVTNTHSGVKATFDSTNNKINITQD